jgi:hypothetical protein
LRIFKAPQFIRLKGVIYISIEDSTESEAFAAFSIISI